MSPITTDHAELGVIKGNAFGKSPYEEHLANGHFRAIRRLICDWGDRNALIADIADLGGQIYPHRTSTGARAYAGNAIGWGRTSAGTEANTIAYEKAMVTIFYATWTPFVTGGWMVTEGIRPSGSIHTLDTDQSDYRWTNASGDPVTGGIQYEEHGLVYSLTFHNVMGVPVAASQYLGYCNASTVSTYTLGLTFGAQTLIHRAPHITITAPWGGISRYKLSYSWEFNYNGWNTRRNPDNGLYAAIYSVAAGAVIPFAPTVNFGLFRP